MSAKEGMSKKSQKAMPAFLLVMLAATLLATPVLGAAVRTQTGFTANTLARNDDLSTGRVPIGFTLNFFGTNFPSLFVNNNGNVTFDRALSTFTPFGLTGTVSQIIAPFFADVDTRAEGSGVVTYGQDNVGGRRAFGVNWINVGYFASRTNRLNSFQLVLIDRSDLATGDFDIEFNYDKIQWETGEASGGVDGLGGNPARVGFSNGSLLPGTFFELPGSGVAGAFLDSNTSSGLIRRSRNSSILGRYLFRVRAGLIEFGGLAISKSGSPDPVPVGGELTYTIRIENTGTSAITRVVLTDPLPPEVNFISSSATQGSCSLSNDAVVCNLGTLNGGAMARATIVVTPTVIGEICNSVSVVASNSAGIAADVCTTATPARTHGQCITRSARFWFSHAYSEDPTCAMLLEAIRTNGGRMGIGFLTLPTTFRNNDEVSDSVDTLIESLGLFWRSASRTGEDGGTQSARLRGSQLCRVRKELAVEIIAATANFLYLGTLPEDCSYFNGVATVPFPMDIVQQARAAGGSDDISAIRDLTLQLRKFNNSGLTNDFFGGLVECTPGNRKTLRTASRDPTSQLTCPGVNDTCETAEPIIASVLPYRRKVNLTPYTDTVGDPGCAVGGRDAVWKIEPPTADMDREFTVDTKGSNFDTMISVWRFGCDVLDPVACSDNTEFTRQARMSFRTDGTNTYFIVIEGAQGNYGSLKLQVTSP